MVCIINTPGEDDGFRLNPDSSPVRYINVVKEAQLLIVDDNRRKQDEVEKNSIRDNFSKREAHIIKRGSSYDNILSTVGKFLSVAKTMEKPIDYVLQYIKYLSSDNLKDNFFHLGEKISNFCDLKKKMVMVDILRRRGKDINKD